MAASASDSSKTPTFPARSHHSGDPEIRSNSNAGSRTSTNTKKTATSPPTTVVHFLCCAEAVHDRAAANAGSPTSAARKVFGNPYFHDAPLSAEGQNAAADLAVQLADVDPTLGVISPLRRSLQTWQAVWPDRQCIVTDAVREFSNTDTAYPCNMRRTVEQGKAQLLQTETPGMWVAANKDPLEDKVESQAQSQERVASLVELLYDLMDFNRIVVVTHPGFLQEVWSYLDLQPKEFKHLDLLAIDLRITFRGIKAKEIDLE